MKQTNFTIKNRKITRVNQVTLTGSYNVDTFKFDFDDEWSGLDKTLVILSGDETYNISLLNDACVLPLEAYENESIQIGLFGKKADNSIILSSIMLDLDINEGAYRDGEEPDNLPTQSQWDVYVAQINSLLSQANATKQQCDSVLTELKGYANMSITSMQTIKNEMTSISNQFNRNATTKLNDYNTNAETKTTSYNENATSKTNDFNLNASTKKTEINNIATSVEQTAEAVEQNKEAVSTMKTSVENTVATFNTNADTKLANYNTNATNKTNEFNSNAEAKFAEFNSSANAQRITNLENNKEDKSNKVTSITSTSTDTQYPSAKAVYSEKSKIDTKIKQIKTALLQGTASDSYITLNDSANMEYEELSVDGVCEQELLPSEYQNVPNPDYPQPISVIENSVKVTSCNKNLTNYSNWEQGNFYVAAALVNINIEDTNVIRMKDFIDISPNTTYTISCNQIIGQFGYVYKDTSNNMAGEYQNITTKYHTFTTPSNAKQVRLRIGRTIYPKSYGTNYELQLEKGSIATPYEEHQETSITFDLSTEFVGKINDTYKDELKVEYNETDGKWHKMLYKKVGKFVLDGSETSMSLQSINSYGITNINYRTGLSNEKNNFNTMSNYFKSQTTTIANTQNEGIYFEWLSELYLRIDSSKAKTVEEFKTWLSTHNTEIYYALETPYTVDLGVCDMALTYDEMTNLFTNSDLLPKINAKYYKDSNKVIENINNRLSLLED